MPSTSFDELFYALIHRYDFEELRTLCAQLDVDFDSLRGEGKDGKARELILYLERHARLDELYAKLEVQSHATPSEFSQFAPNEPSALPVSNLPPKTYSHLWGRDDTLQEIFALLTSSNALPIIAISGLGGIGKTALAREIAERVREEKLFVDVIWESAKRQELIAGQITALESDALTFDVLLDSIARQLGQLDVLKLNREQKLQAVKRLLQKERYLVVVDNLETVDDYKALVVQLRGLLSTSRALLTSRPQLGAFDFVRAIPLEGLDDNASLDLLRQEAQTRGVPAIAAADDATLREIHRITGGAPLALKLVVGQIAVGLPLENVLANLRAAHGDIYPFLYQQSWDLLTEPAQMILIYIGRTVPALASVSFRELAEADIAKGDAFERALQQTVEMSLVNASAHLSQERRRYSIHPLTRHFVLSDLPELWRQQGLLSDIS